VRAVLSGLASGTLTDFDEEAARGLAFVTERGLPGAEPLMLLNGRLTTLGEGFEQEVMTSLSAEVRLVQVYIRIYIFKHKYIPKNIYIYICICIYVYIYMCVCMYTYTLGEGFEQEVMSSLSAEVRLVQVQTKHT